MKTKNAMQLKAVIKNKAVETGVSAQLVLQNYIMERLLERIALSEYKNNFIIKGGFLLSSMIGLHKRTTMDIDATVKGINMHHENIRKIFEEICMIEIDDDLSFKVLNTIDIREQDDYPGIRINLKAEYEKLSIPIVVDISTGDKITPSEIEHKFKMMFENRHITLPAYNTETILAEKLETILSRSIANTRPRDFYDVYILYHLKHKDFVPKSLESALVATSNKRNSQFILENYKNIIAQISKDRRMTQQWESYRRKFNYASDISFEETIDAIEKLMEIFDA
ncbi:MAG: nucleotidyl transferase AbiEii/AbiGii toxin family protein [bacterium]